MITAHPAAPDGSVTRLTSYAPSDFAPSAAVLCRLTAPLISFAFSLIRRNVGCTVLGRDIGAGLVKLIDAQRASSLVELEQKLISSRNRELAKARTDSARANIRDRYDCLNVFLRESGAGSVSALTSRIRGLFGEPGGPLLTLSTIHKAKGLEWLKVFILDEHLMPSPFAEQAWQRKQETNLHYVAITRAKLDLVYIKSAQWAKNEPK